MRVGLTGGIASGKSEVAELWRELGAYIIDADVLARDAVAPGAPALRELATLWPQAISPAGELDRAALAGIVFRDDAARAQLNAIVHPRVRELAAAREAQAPAGALVVHVIPLLFEGEAWRDFDVTVLVVAPDDARLARAIARDNVTRADIERRMRAQIDPAVARGRAAYTIENDGDLATLRARARDLYLRLIA